MHYIIQLLILILFTSTVVVAADDDVVIISASRVSVPEKEVGGSITIINREEIEKSNALTLVDLLRIVPGVAISQSGPLGSLTQVRIRGAEANHVLVLIDGVEANDPATGSEFNFANLSPDSIDKIEVMRGSQSSVWGSDALAGVINITTRTGGADTSFTSIAELGSHDFIRSSASASGGSDKLRFYIQGTYLDTSGENISEQGSENDGYDQSELIFNTQYRIKPELAFGLNARYIDSSNEFDDGTFGSPVDAENSSDVNQFYGSSYLKYSLFENRWNQKLSMSLTDTRNQNQDVFGKRKTEGERLKFDYLSEFILDTKLLSNEQHKFLFSIEQEQERFKQRGPISFGDPNQNQDLTNIGFTTEYRLSISDQLFLSASLRKDDNDEFEDSDTVRFTGAYNIVSTGTKLRASYATGIKNPSFTEVFGFFAGSFVGNPNLKPEKSESWELGFDQSLLADAMHLGATLFWEDLKDEITTVFFPVNTAINLDGRSERNGIEFYFDAKLGSQLDIQGAYTYTDSTVPDANGIQVREIRRPKTVASLQLNYKSLSGKANLNSSLSYVDEQNDLDFATFPAGEVTLDDYYLLNLSGSYNVTDNLNVYMRVNNLFDESYQDVYGFETLGQTVYAGLKVKL